MKTLITLAAASLISSIAAAQITDSSSSNNRQSEDMNRTSNSRMYSYDTMGLYRWNDPEYYRRNRSNFDSLVRTNKILWNENLSYFVRRPGDTVRPYSRYNWVRDSINFERRNWDSLSYWNNNYPWYDESRYLNQDTRNTERNDNASSNVNSSDSSLQVKPGTSGNPQKGDASNTMSGTTGNTGTSGRTDEKKTGTNREQSVNSNKVNTGSEAIAKKTTKTTTVNSKNKHAQNTEPTEDRIYLNKNKLMVSRKGIKSKVGTSIRLDDGTMVYADGTIKKPDGTMSKLNNGESILLKNNSTNEITPNKNQ